MSPVCTQECPPLRVWRSRGQWAVGHGSAVRRAISPLHRRRVAERSTFRLASEAVLNARVSSDARLVPRVDDVLLDELWLLEGMIR